MNATVARLTAGTVLGRRRTALLVLLPAVLLALCLLARLLAGADPEVADELAGPLSADLLAAFGLGVVLPLLGLITGTGVIGAEIDDGSIVYLLAKPLSRASIVNTKFAVAVGVVVGFGAVPVALAALVLTGELGRLALAFFVGCLAAGVAYCAIFLLLSVLTRNAVVIGLLYALVWESLVGQVVPGAQALSVQQWALSVVRAVLGDEGDRLGLSSAVGVTTGVVLLAVVTIGGVWYAGRRLQRIRLGED